MKLVVSWLSLVALVETAALPRTAAAAEEPWVFYMWYADGGDPPSHADCSKLPAGWCATCSGKPRPPAYTCNFGTSVKDCQRQVQAHLNEWYKDFNVVFTYKRPTTNRSFTVLVTNSGAWCGYNYDGISSIDCNGVQPGQTAHAFKCGTDARYCAYVIAQEQAHLVGLLHSTSRTDVLYGAMNPDPRSFEDKVNPIQAPACSRSTQNSYMMMKERLGAWSGGPKPDPFGDLPGPDAGAGPDASRGPDASAGADAGPRSDVALGPDAPARADLAFDTSGEESGGGGMGGAGSGGSAGGGGGASGASGSGGPDGGGGPRVAAAQGCAAGGTPPSPAWPWAAAFALAYAVLRGRKRCRRRADSRSGRRWP